MLSQTCNMEWRTTLEIENLSIEKVLEHELANIPPSLFHDDGTIRPAVKSDLAKKHEAPCDEVLNLPAGFRTGYIIRAMALLQGMNKRMFMSIKQLERLCHGDEKGTSYVIKGGHPVSSENFYVQIKQQFIFIRVQSNWYTERQQMYHFGRWCFWLISCEECK